MVSAVRLRPNHYQTLGLEPTASGDEIARAFAREIGPFRPRPFGGVAEVSIAYATLRDPIRRRAYDRSLGLEPEPDSTRSPAVAVSAAPSIGSAPGSPPGFDEQHRPPPEPRVNPQQQPDPPAEPRTAPFIAASLREPVRPEARHDPSPLPAPQTQQPCRPQPAAEPRLDQHVRDDRDIGRADDPALRDADVGSIEWKRTAMAAGALVAAVGLVGAWAGWEAGNDVAPQPPERTLKVALPPASRPATTADPSALPQPSVAQASPHQPRRPAPAAPRIARTAPPPPAVPDQQPSEVAQAEPSQPEENATEQALADSPPVAPVAASLPLSNRVIARTIQRIGYPCGEVASTAALDGAPGAFKVTCTSGHAYQARPVRGRYHFRRLGGH